MKKVLVTGAAGFIGSCFARRLFRERDDVSIVVLDKLTYAGNLANLEPLAGSPRYRFVKGDIADPEAVRDAMEGCDTVLNFAAETHVDRSLQGAAHFLDTDIKGVFVLLEEARRIGVEKFIQISTDEVYGQILEGEFKETDPLNPRNPYSAAKCGGDRLAYSYWASYGVPVIVTRASNNYGPYHYPEKVIPLFITNAIDDLPLPLYGDGRNVRDWLHVEDHAAGLIFLLEHGKAGETYNIGGGNEVMNVDLTRRILELLGKPETLIRPVADRPGHDRRYALNTDKLKALGWAPTVAFDKGLEDTVKWFVEHESWWRPIKERDPEFKAWYAKNYAERLAAPQTPA
ncbi:MAG: dTDP-glucose 4,6-dehydratase [Acidobacteria bacterium]|nr:dTDP-glucose 4,6-dehydratase [Acidobacteriota bacterium]